MTEQIQRLFISILNPIYENIINRVDPKKREAYLTAIFAALSVYFLLFYSEAFYQIMYTHTQRHVMASILLVLATLFSMDRPLHTVKWRGCIFVPYCAGALGLIITGLIHPIGSGYMTLGFMMLIVYLPLYLVWNNRKDYEKLFDKVTGTNLVTGLIYFAYCMSIYTTFADNMENTRFKGTALNANLFSMIGMAMACSAIYLLYRYRSRSNMLKVLILLSLIPSFIIVVMGQSRSSVIIAAAAAISYIIFRIKNEKNIKRDIKKKIAIIVMGMICILLAFSIVRGVMGDNAANDADKDGFRGRFSTEGKSLDSFTSGRITIWTNYSKHLNMLGNNFEEADWEELTNNKVGHAHNNFLEYGYRCGIPVASIFTILDVIVCILAAFSLFSTKTRRPRFLFVPIFAVMYAVDALLDIATIPFERYAPYFFYILLCVLIDRSPSREDNA